VSTRQINNKRAMDKVMEQTDSLGFVSSQALRSISAPVTRKVNGKNKRIDVTLEEMTDDEFSVWISEKLEGIDCKNRLRFRLFMLAGLDDLKAVSKIHWIE
jgi:hypothetical protein